MENKDINKQINDLILSVGVMGEFMRITRDSLIKNGFTRDEAVMICSNLLTTLITSGANGK